MEPQILLSYFLISLLVTSTKAQGNDPSVSVTVEGGLSLTGQVCPGTVRLVCVGVGLTSLRWSYNGNMIVATYFPDVPPSNRSISNGPFLNIELKTISRNGSFANFTSILTAELSDLRNVQSISCGDSRTVHIEPLSVEIIPQEIPETPNITSVSALYQSGRIMSIGIEWKTLVDARCPQYESQVVYHIRLAGTELIHSQVNCNGKILCNVISTNISSALPNTDGYYNISIAASNVIGISPFGVYPNRVGLNQSYISPYLDDGLTQNCEINGNCVAVPPLTGCMVKYGVNEMFLSNVTLESDSEFKFQVTDIGSDSIYYFQFSVLVNETLLITERKSMPLDSGQCGASQQNIPAIVVPIVIIILLIVVILIVTLVACPIQRKGQRATSTKDSDTCRKQIDEPKKMEMRIRVENNDNKDAEDAEQFRTTGQQIK